MRAPTQSRQALCAPQHLLVNSVALDLCARLDERDNKPHRLATVSDNSGIIKVII